MPLYLTDLPNNATAVITKVKGYGAFRKRMAEMGFVSGTAVKAIKKAPLQDPAEYELMNYHVSLRRSEAAMIEIMACEAIDAVSSNYTHSNVTQWTTPSDETEKSSGRNHDKTIQVALVGNPNCGKTTLFNYAAGRHERVGNYGGVTVDIKTAHFIQQDYRIELSDLPGTYSISEYTPEELYVRKHLAEDLPDVVINVIDASNMERNLFLTTQLIDMNIRVVIALNMYDELQAKGDKFDYHHLSEMIGIPVIPTVASKGKGIGTLLDTVIDVYEDTFKETHSNETIHDLTNIHHHIRHIHINYGEELNQSIQKIKSQVKQHHTINDTFHSQYVAIKLLEDDRKFTSQIASFANSEAIINTAREEISRIEKIHNAKTETLIADAKYAFIRGALKETYQPATTSPNPKGYRADRILTHKWIGIPLFLLFMWTMFQLTFSIGSYPMELIENGVSALGTLIHANMQESTLRDLLVDGIIGGVGGVIVFLPNILILFFCISLMEDTGYMARAAFIMDKVMHKIGLHGKSFIPMLMGFGCGVPAIMATRTLDNRKDRLLTMLIIPFMSCSARLPVYILLISAFFPNNQGLILLSIYATGVFLAAVMAILFRKLLFKKEEVPFVMELPPYRIPTIRNTAIHTWNKSVQYLSKMGTVILTVSILIWALGYFPTDVTYSKNYEQEIAMIQNQRITEEILLESDLVETEKEENLWETEKNRKIETLLTAQNAEHLEQSYIGQLGHFISPVLAPLGYDWKIGVSIITGIAAKEIVVSTMGVLYQSAPTTGESSVNLYTKLQEQTFKFGDKVGEKVFSPRIAYSFMLFVLIYFPCIAAMAAIRREAGLKWAIFTAIYTTVLAWLVAFVMYQI